LLEKFSLLGLNLKSEDCSLISVLLFKNEKSKLKPERCKPLFIENNQKNTIKTQIIFLKNEKSFPWIKELENQIHHKTGKVQSAKAQVIKAQDKKPPELIAVNWTACVNQQGKKKVKIQIKKTILFHFFHSKLIIIFDKNFGKWNHKFEIFGRNFKIQNQIINKTSQTKIVKNELNQRETVSHFHIHHKIQPRIKNHKILQMWKIIWEEIFFHKLIIIQPVNAKQVDRDAIIQSKNETKIQSQDKFENLFTKLKSFKIKTKNHKTKKSHKIWK